MLSLLVFNIVEGILAYTIKEGKEISDGRIKRKI